MTVKTKKKIAGVEVVPPLDLSDVLIDGRKGIRRELIFNVKKASYTEKAAKEAFDAVGVTFKSGDETRIFQFVASDQTQDRHRDVIKLSGWNLKPYKSNPVILWQHNDREPAIGTAIKARKTNGELVLDLVFSKANPMGEMIEAIIEEGHLRAGSVGFIPTEYDYVDDEKEMAKHGMTKPGWVIKKAELLEYSIVNVGANANALLVGMKKSAGFKGFFKEADLDKLIAFTAKGAESDGSDDVPAEEKDHEDEGEGSAEVDEVEEADDEKQAPDYDYKAVADIVKGALVMAVHMKEILTLIKDISLDGITPQSPAGVADLPDTQTTKILGVDDAEQKLQALSECLETWEVTEEKTAANDGNT